jgi:hypothetical protein
MNRLDIKTTTSTTTTTTRILPLSANQVESIVRNWAIKNQGFTAPDVSANCIYSGTFDGMTVKEVTTEEDDE